LTRSDVRPRRSVVFERFDPQPVEALPVALEERQDELLSAVRVVAQQPLQPLALLKRAARLGARLAHDPPGAAPDGVAQTRVSLHGPGQLLERDLLLALPLAT